MPKTRQRRGGATRRWLSEAALLSAALGLGCSDESEAEEPDAVSAACLEAADHLRDCGLLSSGPLDCSNATVQGHLATTAGDAEEVACQLRCAASSECSTAAAIACDQGTGFDSGAATLFSCFRECAEQLGFQCETAGAGSTAVPSSFVCDGENDCEDGSDERGCTLFACGDGQSVATRAVCDGFLHCDNEQDEAMNCPTFACASGSVVPEPFRCDTEADCDDGSDEAGCPQSAVFTCGG